MNKNDLKKNVIHVLKQKVSTLKLLINCSVELSELIESLDDKDSKKSHLMEARDSISGIIDTLIENTDNFHKTFMSIN